VSERRRLTPLQLIALNDLKRGGDTDAAAQTLTRLWQRGYIRPKIGGGWQLRPEGEQRLKEVTQNARYNWRNK